MEPETIQAIQGAIEQYGGAGASFIGASDLQVGEQQRAPWLLFCSRRTCVRGPAAATCTAALTAVAPLVPRPHMQGWAAGHPLGEVVSRLVLASD